MPVTNYPNGVSSFGSVIYSSGGGWPFELGVGDFKYVVAAKSTSDLYFQKLRNRGISSNDIFTLPSAAFDATTANQNDVVLVMPGTYTETETLTWSKAATHMFAIGNPLWRQGGKCRIQTTTIGVAATIDITASGVSMGGFNITQNGADAANLTALRISSTYFTGHQLDLRGHLSASVAGTEAASSLEFADGSSYGFGSTFNNCNIGTGSGAVRTASGATTNGVINFAVDSQSGSPTAYAEFHGCNILSRAETAATAMIKVVDGRWNADRYAMFKDCFFFNFWMGNTDQLEGCFYFDVTTRGSGTIVLIDCTSFGIDEWVTQDSGHVWSNMPVSSTQGGLTREPTAPVS